MKRWEYFDAYNLNIMELDKLGAKGWELVSCCHCHDTGNDNLKYIFKRETNALPHGMGLEKNV